MNDTLLYLASALTGFWGVAHLAATKGVVEGFGGITLDNRRIITMEWIVEILGGDVAGSVEAVGDEVTSLKPGDEVYGDLCMSGFGAFAEYVCAPEACLAHKPPQMTFVQAAAIPQAGMLAGSPLHE